MEPLSSIYSVVRNPHVASGCLFCMNTQAVVVFLKICFILPGQVSVPRTFLSTVFVKLSYLKCYHATKGSFPDINIETKMNCLTLSKVSMWWRERGWRGKAINNNKKRLPNIETEISRWKFVMVFPREPKGERSREGKGKREETKSVESCLRVTCEWEQS